MTKNLNKIIFILIVAFSIVTLLCSNTNEVETSTNTSSDKTDNSTEISSNNTQENNVENSTSTNDKIDDPVNKEIGTLINYPDLRKIIENLSSEEQQHLSDKLYLYSKAEKIDIKEGIGINEGSKNSQYKFIEFFDFNCSHCKKLSEALAYLSYVLGNRIYVESRIFPIEIECNSIVPEDNPFNGHGGCELAKASICAGEQGKFIDFKYSLFLYFNKNFEERIQLAIQETKINPDKFDECMLSERTEKTLEKYVESGKDIGIEGTPYLILNGKKSSISRLFIVAMLLSYNNTEHNIFKELLPEPKFNDNE